MKKNIFLYHNSHDLLYRNPYGAVSCETKVTFRLKHDLEEEIVSIFLRIWIQGREERIEMTRSIDSPEFFEASYEMPEEPGLIWYYFIIKMPFDTLYYGNNEERLGGEGQIWTSLPPAYQITVYKKGLKTPKWFKKGIMYQIMVDRFYNGNPEEEIAYLPVNAYLHQAWDETPFYLMHPYKNEIAAYNFFGGNLLGILKKLDYLQQLGISIIYLNPVFEAESNHKYDTGNYHQIDPMFGTNELFEQLTEEAGKRGIKIILDGVFSHTGSNSIYFNKKERYESQGAYQSKNSTYYSWYNFKNYPEEYDSWWGIDTLPNVNELDPSYQEFICTGMNSVLNHWMKKGVKGWRLDVADELPDEFIKLIKKTIKGCDEEAILIGEVWEDASNKESYGQLKEYLWGEELDSVMNYPFKNILIDFMLNKINASETKARLLALHENYPPEIFYSCMNLIGSHDSMRILTVLGEVPAEETLSKKEAALYRLSAAQKEVALKRLKLLSLLQFTFPGVPSIYYGDEAEREGYSDPYNRATYPWGKENKDLLAWYKDITALRNKYASLSTGDWLHVIAEGDLYGYVRRIRGGQDLFNESAEDSQILVIINRNAQDKFSLKLDLNPYEAEGKALNLLNGEEYYLEAGYLDLELKPLEGKVIKIG